LSVQEYFVQRGSDVDVPLVTEANDNFRRGVYNPSLPPAVGVSCWSFVHLVSVQDDFVQLGSDLDVPLVTKAWGQGKPAWHCVVLELRIRVDTGRTSAVLSNLALWFSEASGVRRAWLSRAVVSNHAHNPPAATVPRDFAAWKRAAALRDGFDVQDDLGAVVADDVWTMAGSRRRTSVRGETMDQRGYDSDLDVDYGAGVASA
jgi:hypothetical protein